MYADLPPPIPDIALSSAGGRPLRVAVVGSGIAGLAVAHSLRGLARVTLFEAGDYFGGHTHTVDITQPTFSANNPLPLILPTAANVKALAADVSSKMPAFLAQAGIPSAPASISYDAEGQLTLPADYPYAAQFKAALDSAPAFSHEIAALNGIASQAADLIRMAPAQAALEKATTDAEAQAILQQYGMKEGHHSPLIALLFDANAQLSISADGEPVPDFA